MHTTHTHTRARTHARTHTHNPHTHTHTCELNLDLIDDVSVLGIAPWTLSVPTVRFDLTSFKKDITDPETYKQF